VVDTRNCTSVDLVLLDVRMAGRDGPETLAALQALDPSVRACFMTGDSGRYSDTELLNRGALAVIRKPFAIRELARQFEAMFAPAI
jgi:DNA-binding response OmpR family regulator